MDGAVETVVGLISAVGMSTISELGTDIGASTGNEVETVTGALSSPGISPISEQKYVLLLLFFDLLLRLPSPFPLPLPWRLMQSMPSSVCVNTCSEVVSQVSPYCKRIVSFRDPRSFFSKP
jgi:hypothetical protein